MRTFKTKLSMPFLLSSRHLPILTRDKSILNRQPIKTHKFSIFNLPSYINIKVTIRISRRIISLINFIIRIKVICVNHFFYLIIVLGFQLLLLFITVVKMCVVVVVLLHEVHVVVHFCVFEYLNI